MSADPDFAIVASAARKWRMGRMFGGVGIKFSLTDEECDAVQLVLDLAAAELELASEAGDDDPVDAAAVRKVAFRGPPTWLVVASIIFLVLSLTGWIAAGIMNLLSVLGLV